MALLRSSAPLAALLLVAGLLAGGARANALSEYAVKAAFLLNFARLVEWPEGAFAGPDAPVVVGVAGEGAYEAAREAGITGERVGSRPVELRRLRSPEEAASCHIVFVSLDGAGLAAASPAELGGGRALTVGEAEDFVNRGGMIGFYREGQKVRFEINPKAAQRAGLRISSRLLRVARIAGS